MSNPTNREPWPLPDEDFYREEALPRAIDIAQNGTRSQRRVLAAIALYGQPFGFTREDVKAIRDLLRMGCTCGVIEALDYKDWDDAQNILPTLADRIEALLPPEE